jgi:hypothetical protein
LSELIHQLVVASPFNLALAALAVLVVGLAGVIAPVLKLEAKAWFLRRQGVPTAQIRAWALDEAKRERPSPVVEIINAIRGNRDDEQT